MLSLGIKIFFATNCDVNYCAWGTKLRYAYKVNDVIILPSWLWIPLLGHLLDGNSLKNSFSMYYFFALHVVKPLGLYFVASCCILRPTDWSMGWVSDFYLSVSRFNMSNPALEFSPRKSFKLQVAAVATVPSTTKTVITGPGLSFHHFPAGKIIL